jgi:hypothetical protein
MIKCQAWGSAYHFLSANYSNSVNFNANARRPIDDMCSRRHFKVPLIVLLWRNRRLSSWCFFTTKLATRCLSVMFTSSRLMRSLRRPFKLQCSEEISIDDNLRMLYMISCRTSLVVSSLVPMFGLVNIVLDYRFASGRCGRNVDE